MGSKKAITRDRIVDVAFEMAREQGLASLSVRGVAQACGVATGTMYNHIPDIAELRTEVLERFWRSALSDAELDACTCGAETALDYCRRLVCALEGSLRGFRDGWLRDLGSLDGRTRARTAEAERACLAGLQRTVRHAFERDPAIGEAVRRELEMNRVADFVWEAMLMSLKRDDGSHETLFALVDRALYR